MVMWLSICVAGPSQKLTFINQCAMGKQTSSKGEESKNKNASSLDVCVRKPQNVCSVCVCVCLSVCTQKQNEEQGPL
jgi:hypothetical protein